MLYSWWMNKGRTREKSPYLLVEMSQEGTILIITLFSIVSFPKEGRRNPAWNFRDGKRWKQDALAPKLISI